MQPNSARARDRAYVVHQQTNLATFDRDGGTLITGGDGIYVFDEDGKRYLEAMAGMWSASLGFSEKRLAEVAYRQMQELPFYHVFHARGHVPSVDLADRLRVRGWQVPAYTLPANRQDQAIQRILVRNGVSYDLCSLLVDHINAALEHFKDHPIQESMSKHEASGFHH